tara:strand:+ start:1757 stop:2674 length:918 start_codon:yes stop_codon:yes gene_type:complete
MKNILFRTDSSDKIGTGHIMRSLVLANQFKNDKITFAVQDLPRNINYRIKNAGYNIEILKSDDINELIQLINKYKIDLIVIDHYGINYKDERKIKDKTNIKIFSLDDTYKKHCCDILLNHNIGANPLKYKELVPQNTELRCGQKYSLIREEFKKEKKTKNFQEKGHLKKIMVSMGGTDALNLNIEILKVLMRFKNIEVNIVSTNANNNLNKLKSFICNYSNVNLYIDTNKMAQLMNNANLVITTPSVTMNEVFYMEVPFIGIKIAENQNEIYKYLKENNFPVMNNFDHATLYRLLIENIDGINNE